MKKLGLTFGCLLAVFLALTSFNQVFAQNMLNEIGGFEGTLPAYWNIGNQPTGSTLTWATDQSLSMGHSIEIQKTATGDSASWISDNMCDIWSPTVSSNVDLLFGAWIKTQNVNTNPASDIR